MTPQQILWEALRLRVSQKQIGLGGSKTKRPHKAIHQDIRYRKAMGLCPICKERPAKRETCGSEQCVSLWTIGYVPSYYRKWTWKGTK